MKDQQFKSPKRMSMFPRRVGMALLSLLCFHLRAEVTDLRGHWTFDEQNGPVTRDQVRSITDSLNGHLRSCPGVSGSALKFDGFTTRVTRSADQSPRWHESFSIEAWIAPQEYSWAWTGIVDHDQDRQAGYSLGINSEGRVGLQAALGGRWQTCLSEHPIPLLEWTHIVGVFKAGTGLAIYVNGTLAGKVETPGAFQPAQDLDLWLGMSHRPQYPDFTERKGSQQFLSSMVFDGLIDEVKIYGQALTREQIRSAFKAPQPSVKQPLSYRQMPAGPEGKRPFGANYTALAYCPEWDRLWRTGDHADVLVCFDELPVRLVFWRGTGYCPAWVTENGKWVSDQSPESWNFDTLGCFEQMSDKQCRYSHVRLLENNPARVVMHWRTASPAIDYSFNHVNPNTGWAEWTDEYYYIYPDAVAVRYQEVHSDRAVDMEWQQSELLNQPGTRPQDNVELDAVTVVNMRGDTETWTWAEPYGRRKATDQPIEGGLIQVTNLKSAQRHFVIGETGAEWKPFTFGAREGFSTIPCWNHWPVAQLPNDGRVAPAADRPSSSCFGTLYPVKHRTDEPDLMIGRNLYGMTAKEPQALAVLARSWNHPPDLRMDNPAWVNQGYDKNQRVYVLTPAPSCSPNEMRLRLMGSFDSPIQNPAFVFNQCAADDVEVWLEGEPVQEGKRLRIGREQKLSGSTLLVWVKAERTRPMELLFRWRRENEGNAQRIPHSNGLSR